MRTVLKTCIVLVLTGLIALGQNVRDAVPESWQWPLGPYKQAPAEYGGQWWKTDPFRGDQPWLNAVKPLVVLPPGFLTVYGPRPEAKDFRGDGYPQNFQKAVGIWDQNLKGFKGIGGPEWMDAAKAVQAYEAFRAWGLGEPVLFEGLYGYMARFNGQSDLPGWQASAYDALESPQLTICRYQIDYVMKFGKAPPVGLHPFLKGTLNPELEDKESAPPKGDLIHLMVASAWGRSGVLTEQ